MVHVVWEFRFPPAALAEGEQVVHAIWRDMTRFDGYVDHEVVRDVDDPGHLVVLSRWTSREHADRIRDEYAGHPNAVLADSLVSQPRRRVVAATVG